MNADLRTEPITVRVPLSYVGRTQRRMLLKKYSLPSITRFRSVEKRRWQKLLEEQRGWETLHETGGEAAYMTGSPSTGFSRSAVEVEVPTLETCRAVAKEFNDSGVRAAGTLCGFAYKYRPGHKWRVAGRDGEECERSCTPTFWWGACEETWGYRLHWQADSHREVMYRPERNKSEGDPTARMPEGPPRPLYRIHKRSATRHLWCTYLSYGSPPPLAWGYELSHEKAVAAALCAAREHRIDICDAPEDLSGSIHGDEHRRWVYAQERKETAEEAPRPDASSATARGYVYRSGGGSHYCRHEVLKRTKKRVFVSAYPQYVNEDGEPLGVPVDREWDEKTFGAYGLQRLALDRELLESGGCVHRDWYTYSLKLPERAVVKMYDCFTVLGFKEPPRSAEAVERQFRREAKVRHPDKGGSGEAFKALQAAYEAALGLVHA